MAWTFGKLVTVLSLAACLRAQSGADQWPEVVQQIRSLEAQGKRSRALALTNELISELTGTSAATDHLAQAIDRRASIEQDIGKYREAERDYFAAIDAWKRCGAADSISMATELNNLASLYSSLGQLTKAERMRRQSLSLRIRLLGSKDPDVALSFSNLAIDLFRQSKLSESADAGQNALEIWSQVGGEQSQSDLALNTLALIKLKQQRYASAVNFAQSAIIRARDRQVDASAMATYEHTLALAMAGAGNTASSEEAFRRSLTLVDLQSANSAPSLLRVELLTDYARFLKLCKRGREAKRLAQRADAERRAVVQVSSLRDTISIDALLLKTR